MAGAVSKEEANDKVVAQKKEVALVLSIANGVFMTATMMILPARAPMVLEIMGGDAQKAAKTLGFMSSCGAVLEVFLNPVFGRLSDKYGRKPFLIIAPFVRAVLHAVAATFPRSIEIQYLDRIITAAMVFTFQAPVNAALTDACSDEELAVAMSRNSTFFGLGCALGPFLGSKLSGTGAFFSSSALFASCCLYLMAKFPETLRSENRKEFDITACSPLRFLKLFQGGRLSAIASTIALQSFGDYPNIYDFNFLYLKSVFSWGQAEVGRFATAVGITQILGGEATGLVIRRFGQSTAIMLSNLSWICSMGLLGTSRSLQQLAAALVAMTFGHLRATPVDANLQKIGKASGMGKGELISARMNLTALIKVVAPILYGRVFAWATSKGRNLPGMPYLLICSLTVLAQLCFWSQEREDDDPKAFGGRRN